MKGIFARFNAALVIIAGVGADPPSETVLGISVRQRGLSCTIISTSAAGVYSVKSELAPAPVIPGIFEVAVVAIVHKNNDFLSIKLSRNSVEPYTVNPSYIIFTCSS